MKRKKVALYSPYLDTLGGGEKYILSAISVLEKMGYDAYIFWDEDISEKIKNRLNISFSALHFLPNIFKRKGSFLKKMLYLKQFDTFLYVTDGSYFFSLAKHNFVYAMVPKREIYKLSIINKLKLANYRFITHSQFTFQYLQRLGIKSKVLYPYLDSNYTEAEISDNKKPVILAVGRFFKHLHAKRQDLMIETFKRLKKTHKEFSSFTLVLTGGLMDEDKDYFEQLKLQAADDNSIMLKPNLPYSDLIKLYDQSLFFWHFTGYGIDDEQDPEKVEHLGITPLEAMARGCIVFCYKAGGPKELIKTDSNGYLFSQENELIDLMEQVLADETLQKNIQNNAHTFVKEHFSYELFKNNVANILQLEYL